MTTSRTGDAPKLDIPYQGNISPEDRKGATGIVGTLAAQLDLVNMISDVVSMLAKLMHDVANLIQVLNGEKVAELGAINDAISQATHGDDKKTLSADELKARWEKMRNETKDPQMKAQYQAWIDNGYYNTYGGQRLSDLMNANTTRSAYWDQQNKPNQTREESLQTAVTNLQQIITSILQQGQSLENFYPTN
jgi:hypothetical protein